MIPLPTIQDRPDKMIPIPSTEGGTNQVDSQGKTIPILTTRGSTDRAGQQTVTMVGHRMRILIHTHMIRNTLERMLIIGIIAKIVTRMYKMDHFYLKLILLLLFVLHCWIFGQPTGMNSLDIVAWNMRGFAGGKYYLKELVKNHDIIAISEHWLYPQEESRMPEWIPNNYECIIKCSQDLQPDNCNRVIGHAGIGLCWKKSPGWTNVKVESDRICILRIPTSKAVIFIVAVYLPPVGSKLANFHTVVDMLSHICEDLSGQGMVCIIGDFNVQGMKGRRK